MSFSSIKRESYQAQKKAGQGAGITLVYGCGQFTALFECATHCAEILGQHNLEDIGDGLLEYIPRYQIDLLDISSALLKLTKKYSVSIVDFTSDKQGSRFVLVWKISPVIPLSQGTLTPSMDVNDY